MNEPLPSPLAPFAWVCKRDGRLVPFDADKVARALFAATESMGQPDAFLARELTDVVLHFLAAEAAETTPTTAQIAELVVKVIRELGHASLARAFAETKPAKRQASAGPTELAEADRPQATALAALDEWVERASGPVPLVWQVGGACLRDYSLRHVFPRDLVAAHEAGLITLMGLEAPRELTACVLGPQAVGCGPWAVGERLIEAIEHGRHAAGVFLAIDSPEYGIAHCPQTPSEYARDLHFGLRANGIPAVLNLNCATPPVWADDLAEGPLFADYRQSPTPQHLGELADTLLEELALRHRRQAVVRIDWHLGPRDVAPEGANRLMRVARWVAEDARLAFVFDRTRRPVVLAEGLDRKNTSLLLTVGLNLPRLAEILPAPADPEVFLQKLGSLVRLALSAGVQKRDFLRRHSQDRPALTRAFLLDRARLMVVPVGLEAVTRTLAGSGLTGTGPGSEFGRRVIQRLQAILRQDGPACHLEACLDGPGDFDVGNGTGDPAGLTPWDMAAEPESQLRAAGLLHASAEGGTCAVLLPPESTPSAEMVAAWLRYAWNRTEVVRLRFLRRASRPAQRTAPWVLETAGV